MKRILAVVVTMSLILSLAACGSSAAVSKSSTSDDDEVVRLETETAEETAVPEEEETAVPEEEETAVPEETEEAEEVIGTDSVEPVTVVIDSAYKPLETGEERWDWVNTETPSLDPDSAEKYPVLAEAIDSFSDELTALGESESADITAALEEFPSDEMFYSDTKLTVKRADSTAVSILERRESYMGGAHPSFWYETRTIDSVTGTVLDINDILNDPASLPGQLAPLVEETAGKDNLIVDSVEQVIKDEMDPQQEDYILNYTLSYDGITFWFSPYEMTSYAAGGIVVKMPYAEYPGLVKEEYAALPENYFLPVSETEQVRLPDGSAYFSWFMGEGDDYDERDLHLVTCPEYQLLPANSEKDRITASASSDITFRVTSFDPADAYVMFVDGRTVFVYEASMVDDYSQLHLFDITDPGNASELPVIERYFGKGKPTDPKKVFLSHGVDILSTYTAGRYYSFDGTGTAAPLSDWDDIILYDESAYNITLKQDATLPKVDPATLEANGEISIPAGSKLTFVRTDSERTVDMKTEDGTEVRITQEGDGWPYTVNGIEIDDLFDGMMFAG